MTDRCRGCDAPLPHRAAFCSGCGEFAGEAPPHPAEVPGAAGRTAARPAPRSSRDVAATVATAQPALLDDAPGRAQTGSAGTDPLRSGSADDTAATFPRDLDVYRARLQETFGYPDFRGGQARVLECLAERDVLAVMPTGSGKSLCYALPALEVGRTLVVSPLIALMQDQVEGLRAAGVSATFINSNLDRDEQNRRYRAFIGGQIDLLFVAPERFANAAFTRGLRAAGVHLLAIDEAHCISEWGHNFRPDYLQLGAVRERLGEPRTLALTATANPQVRSDIVRRLGIAEQADEVVTTVDRPNLTYAVEAIDSLQDRRRWAVDYVGARRELTGIIYVRTRRGVEELASELQQRGLAADAYHAGLERERRTRVQRAFTTGELPVIVATNAFGMGIDKPDVRYVIHLNMPGRLEAYYQEAGRAGRDGDPAECTLLYARADRRAQQRMIDEAHPAATTVRDAWRRWVRLADPESGRLPYDLGQEDPDAFGMIVSALRDSGLLEPVALRVTSYDPNAPIETRTIEQHRAYAEARLRDMAEYAESRGCRRATILRYFGEEADDACEGCDNCLQQREPGRAPAGPSYPDDLHDALVEFRNRLSRETGRDPHFVFENRTARELATYRPRTQGALREIWGIGSRRASWFGEDVIRIIEDWEQAHPEAEPPPAPPVRSRDSAPREAGSASAGGGTRRARVLGALVEWRRRTAESEGIPASRVARDRTLERIADRMPESIEDLRDQARLDGSRANRYGDAIISIISRALATEPESVARAAESVRPDDPLYETLRQWRIERARSEGVPAYAIFSDRTLRELVAIRPRNVHALLRIWGLGEARVDRFGAELVQVIRDHPAG